MKKFLLSMLAGVVIIGAASAVPSPDERKKRCEQTKGFIWVPNANACIEENPCKSDDKEIEEAYCERIFRDVETHGDLYKGLIELYAETHKLQCEPVDQKAKNFGQDYVMCKGRDVKMFEFNDIHDTDSALLGFHRDYAKRLAQGLCWAVSGRFSDEYGYVCNGIDEYTCRKIDDTVKRYPRERTDSALDYDTFLYGAIYDTYGTPTCHIDVHKEMPEHLPTLGELAPGYDSEASHSYSY